MGATLFAVAAVLACAGTGSQIVFDFSQFFGRVLAIDEGPRRVMRFGRRWAPTRARSSPGTRARSRSNTCATRCWASRTIHWADRGAC